MAVAIYCDHYERQTRPVATSSIESLLKLAAAGHGSYAICGAARNSLDRKRRIYPSHRGKNRAVANPQIGDIPAAAIRIHNTCSRIVAHTRRPVQMARIVVLRPDFARVDGLQRLRHEFQGMIDEALIVVTP